MCAVHQDRNIHVILCLAEAFRARDRNTHGGHETGKTEFFYDDVSEKCSHPPCLQALPSYHLSFTTTVSLTGLQHITVKRQLRLHILASYSTCLIGTD